MVRIKQKRTYFSTRNYKSSYLEQQVSLCWYEICLPTEILRIKAFVKSGTYFQVMMKQLNPEQSFFIMK